MKRRTPPTECKFFRSLVRVRKAVKPAYDSQVGFYVIALLPHKIADCTANRKVCGNTSLSTWQRGILQSISSDTP